MDLIFHHWFTLVVAGVFTCLQELQRKPSGRVSVAGKNFALVPESSRELRKAKKTQTSANSVGPQLGPDSRRTKGSVLQPVIKEVVGCSHAPLAFGDDILARLLPQELREYTSTWPKPGTSLIGSKRGRIVVFQSRSPSNSWATSLSTLQEWHHRKPEGSCDGPTAASRRRCYPPTSSADEYRIHIFSMLC